jgi:hypothetical protein
MKTLIAMAVAPLLAASPVLPLVPDDNLVIPGQRIGRWTLGMTLKDLGRVSGPLIRHVSPVLWEMGQDVIACCPEPIRVHWEVGLAAVARFPMDRLHPDLRYPDGDYSRADPKNLPAVGVEYLYVHSFGMHGASEKFKTTQGISAWSSTAVVVRVYGRPTAVTDIGQGRAFRLIYDNIGLAVIRGAGGGVGELIVFRPGTAKELWKF